MLNLTILLNLTERGICKGAQMANPINKEKKMYVNPNFKTKKEFKEAIKNGERVTAFQPGGMFPGTTNGRAAIEGPHFPQPHKWYASVVLENSVVVKILN
jgi:hypothetical protein